MCSRGVASCAQASLSGYPTTIRRELSIPDDLRVLCGISFGYEDPAGAGKPYATDSGSGRGECDVRRRIMALARS